MTQYGMPYMGNKSTIADDIINFLPAGNRFVDLFGGGGAITHCAVLSKKWNHVLYNELNPLVAETFKKAINGDYNYKKFKPEFITREKFFELKDIDGYVKICYSFGNGGRTYFCGKDKEDFKKHGHNLVVFNDVNALKFIEDYFKNSFYWHIKHIYNENPKISRQRFVNIILKLEAIRVTTLYNHMVYNEYKNLSFDEFNKLSGKEICCCIDKYIPNIPKKNYKGVGKVLSEIKQLQLLQLLQQLEQLEQLQRLQLLQQLQRLVITNDTYLNYQYVDGVLLS